MPDNHAAWTTCLLLLGWALLMGVHDALDEGGDLSFIIADLSPPAVGGAGVRPHLPIIMPASTRKTGIAKPRAPIHSHVWASVNGGPHA